MASTAASERTRRPGAEDVGDVAARESRATLSEAMQIVKSDCSREQEAERLDAAGDVDRFAVAIGEVDLLVHDSAAACSKGSKAARADPTGSSSSQARRRDFQNGEKLRPEAGPRHGRERRPCRKPADRRMPHRLQQKGRAETGAFQNIQRAEHCEAIGNSGASRRPGIPPSRARSVQDTRRCGHDRPNRAAVRERRPGSSDCSSGNTAAALISRKRR